MIFGRTHEQWLAMTPAQLDVLARVHNKTTRPRGGGGQRVAGASRGSGHDLFMLAGMQRV